MKKKLRFLTASCAFGLALILSLSPIHAQKAARPDRYQDSYFSQGASHPLAIASDRIGVVARRGQASQVREMAAQLGFQVVGTYHETLFVLQLREQLERPALVRLARDLKDKKSELFLQAGLVAEVNRDEAPLILTDELIVGFSKGATREQIEALNASFRVRTVMDNPFVTNQLLLSVTADSPGDSLQVANRYRQEAIVEYAYPNFINVFVDHDTIPNDTLFGNQWHHRNTGQSGGTVDADADISMAWDITQGAAGTLIVVLENGGFDMAHPDLTPNLWANPGEVAANGVDDDGNGFVDDVRGWDFEGCTAPAVAGCGDNDPSPAAASENHGTAVAGVAAARGGNALGVAGSCPSCSLILLRTGYVSADWAKSLAFGYGQQTGARIITNSWGGGGATPNTITAINTVTAAGVVVLFAAGNSAQDVCTGPFQDSRVSLPDVIAVSSSSNQDRKVTGHAFGSCIDILAPTRWGAQDTSPTGTLAITTTDRTGSAGYNSADPACSGGLSEGADTNYTSCFSGTSSATPLTAGAVGLVLTVNPGLTRLQVQQLLQDTADRIEDSVGAYDLARGFSSPAVGSPTHSWGRLNAFEAVRIAAPVAQGGRGGVDVFVRDNRLDWGNTEQPSNTLFEAVRGYIGHWQSVDIKVDAPPYQPAPTAATFDAFTDETPSAIAGELNRAYVRVRNRGPVTAASVAVKLHWSQFGTALPALPPDFWTAFPSNSADVSQWHPLNCAGSASSVCTITNLAYSGSSVAATGLDPAQIVQFDFPAPPVDPLLANHFCLLAMIDSAQDPISAGSKSTQVVDAITPTDNNVTHRNYYNLLTDLNDSFTQRFFVRNPTTHPVRVILQVQAPQGWEVKLDKLSFETPFALEPGQEILVEMQVMLPRPGLTGEVTIAQQELQGANRVTMGGLTLGFAPKKQGAGTPPGATPGALFDARLSYSVWNLGAGIGSVDGWEGEICPPWWPWPWPGPRPRWDLRVSYHKIDENGLTRAIPLELGLLMPLVREAQRVTPYVGAGLGYYLLDGDAPGIEDEFGAYGVLGADIWLAKRWGLSVEGGYREVGGDLDLSGPTFKAGFGFRF